MGKTGKQQKKLKLMNAAAVAAERTEYASDNEGEETWNVDGTTLSARDLSAALKVLTALGRYPDSLKEPQYKPLRTALHALKSSKTPAGVSLSGQISDALADECYAEALVLLQEMRSKSASPKLGALQRWVRSCDAASADGSRNAHIMKVLDSILRTADPTLVGALAKSTIALENPTAEVIGGVRLLGKWNPLPNRPVDATQYEQQGDLVHATPQQIDYFKPQFTMIYNEHGQERRPPNQYPMIIYTNSPTMLKYTPDVCTTRVEVADIPGAFLLQDLFSMEECRQLLLACETVGFTPDLPLSTGAGNSILAHNVFWLTDPTLTSKLESRALPFMPKTMLVDEEDGVRVLDGINPRWRVYRYVPGAVYRPHIDGAWPKSSYDTETKQYVYDASNGSSWSRLTMVIYLNEGFAGGETTFFVPSTRERVMDAVAVVPKCGCALLFPHGSVKGNLLHEGSAVMKGAKYIVRTDVLYRKEE